MNCVVFCLFADDIVMLLGGGGSGASNPGCNSTTQKEATISLSRFSYISGHDRTFLLALDSTCILL